MKAVNVLILIVLAALAALGAWLLAFRPGATAAPPATADEQALFAPTLRDNAQAVRMIEVESAEGRVALEELPTGWAVQSVGGYPADVETVRRLLTTLSEVRTVEAKTARPELHDRLGVQWPADEAAADDDADANAPAGPTLVRLLGENGLPVAEIVLGETTFEAQQSRQYARHLGEDQSWLISARIDAPTDGMRWLSSRFIQLPRESVRRVTITHPDGATVTLARDDAEADFDLESPPEGMERISEGLTNRVGSALSMINFTDVAPAEGWTAPGEPVVAVYEMFGGPALTFRVWPDEDAEASWVRAEASGGEGDDNASAFGTRWSGFVFRLGRSPTESLTRRPEDLMQAAATDEAGPAAPDEIVPELLRPPGDG